MPHCLLLAAVCVGLIAGCLLLGTAIDCARGRVLHVEPVLLPVPLEEKEDAYVVL